MKNNLSLISRLATVAVAAGGLCYSNVAFGQSADAPSAETKAEAAPTPVSSMAGVGQKPRKSEAAKANAASPKTGASMKGAGMSDMDRQFVQMAAMGGMKEVHMGQMASQQGQSDAVKTLGGRIASDHTKANNELMGLATKRGMKLDPMDKMGKMAKMTKKEMANFDQSWLTSMMNDHMKDIASYDKAAKGAADPEVKAYAKKTLPVLKNHLKMVKAAQSKMMAKKS